VVASIVQATTTGLRDKDRALRGPYFQGESTG
jgi:hypothetical protein